MNASTEPSPQPAVGRKENLTLQLRSSTELSLTHELKSRSKVVVPKLHPPPPSMPSALNPRMKSVQKKKKKKTATNNKSVLGAAHEFARYALILHEPWPFDEDLNRCLPKRLTWSALIDFVSRLKITASCRTDAHDSSKVLPDVARVQLVHLKVLANGLIPDDATKQAITKQRSSCCDKWGSNDYNPEAYFHRGNRRAATDDSAAETDGGLDDASRTAAIKEIDTLRASARRDDAATNRHTKLINFCTDQAQTLSNVFSTVETATDAKEPHNLLLNKSIASVSRLSEALKNRNAEPALPASKQPADKHTSKVTADTAQNSSHLDLNEEQELCRLQAHKHLSSTATWLKGERQGTRPRGGALFITGGPGSGKTKLIKSILKDAEDLNVTVIQAAPMASAANLMSNEACTLHGALGLNIKKETWRKNPRPQVIDQLQRRHNSETLAAVIIDEVSAMEPELFLQLNKRTQLIMESDEFMGGLTLICVGDLFQLPPVASPSVMQCVINYYVQPKGTSYTDTDKKVAELFTSMTKFELKENHRAKSDPKWAELIRKMRTAVPGARPLEHLRSQLEGMILKKSDVDKNPEWNLAPICCAGNFARTSLIKKRAHSVAKLLGVPVVRWKLPISGDVANRLTSEQLDALYESDPRLWGIFIAGGDAYLSQNVNPERMVSNGTPVVFHSLTLGDKEEKEDENRMASNTLDEQHIVNAKAGDDVELENPPFAINVVLATHQAAAHEANQEGLQQNGAREKWASIVQSYSDVTIVKDEVVIPILMEKKDAMKCFVPGHGMLTIKTVQQHACDSAIAGTFYKFQGRTMPLVLGCFNKPPQMPNITYEAVIVMLSRVCHSSHCKLLPLLNGQNLDHILKLHPNKYLIAFMNGYDESGRFSIENATEAWETVLDLEQQIDNATQGKHKSSHPSGPKQKKTKSVSSSSSSLSNRMDSTTSVTAPAQKDTAAAAAAAAQATIPAAAPVAQAATVNPGTAAEGTTVRVDAHQFGSQIGWLQETEGVLQGQYEVGKRRIVRLSNGQTVNIQIKFLTVTGPSQN